MDNHVTYLGLDPGQSGGIAAIGFGPVTAWPMPQTDAEILSLLRELGPTEAEKEAGRTRVFAVLEKVNAMSPGRQACFQLGGSYRALRMALTAAGIPFEEIRPEDWQRAVGVPPQKKPKLTYAKRKARLRQRAQALFPGVTVKNETADALLLARYCQVRNGSADK